MQDDKKRLKLAEEALTPSEEHKIEVRVDKMMQFEPEKSKKTAKAPDPVAENSDTPETTKVATAPDVPADLTDDISPESSAVDLSVPPSEAAEAETATATETDTLEEPTPAEEATAPAETETAVDELADLSAEPVTESPKKATAAEQSTDEVVEPDQTVSGTDYDAEAAEIAAAFVDPEAAPKHRWRHLLGWLRHGRKAKWLGLGLLVAILAITFGVPASRSWAFNLAGLRGEVALTVLDATTQLPLKNVSVSVGGRQATSNVKGMVTIPKVKVGNQQLIIKKSAFTTLHKQVAIKLGTNHLETVKLAADGTQFQLRIINYVTGKPIAKALAVSGQATALADAQGLVTLTVPEGTTSDQQVTITADDYRSQTVHVDSKSSAVSTVQLVTVRSEVYFSNQSGNYDLYKSDIDGRNSKVLLKATGTETKDLALLVHPTAEEAAIVDTRDNNRDSGGYLLQTLTLVNVTTGAPTTIDHSERIVLVNWLGDRLVYVMAKAGASAASTSRYQLMSYDYRTNQRLELDHANAFNDVVSSYDAVYYAISNQYNGGTSQFITQHADGTNKQVLLNAEVWNIFRKDYSNFYLSTSTDSYTYKLGDAKPLVTKDGYSGTNKLFVDSPDGKRSLWIEQRDGKSTLLVHDNAKQTDSVLVSQAGVASPLRWVSSDTVIYRVSTPSETADYVIGIGSNTAKKITDLTAASGRALWYYY